jgi:hypothetical protein
LTTPNLDQFFVLSYYLFYPLTEPPPPNPDLVPGSTNLSYREGQWEAVSFYFQASPDGGQVGSADTLVVPDDPANFTPAHAVLSQGITYSGDGRSPQVGANYPAQVGSWPAGGDTVYQGGFPYYGEELVPQPVFVTCGTHKNLFSPTPEITTSDPNQDGPAAGASLEGAGTSSRASRRHRRWPGHPRPVVAHRPHDLPVLLRYHPRVLPGLSRRGTSPPTPVRRRRPRPPHPVAPPPRSAPTSP